MPLLLRNARVVNARSPFNGQTTDLLIEGGIITAIGSGLDAGRARTVLDGEDLHLSSGWVDVFADYCEPGYEHRETIATGLDSAAAGGFTDVFLTPNTQPAVSEGTVVQYLRQKAAGHAVSLHPLGAITEKIEGKKLAEMLDMRAQGALAFTDGWKPVQHPALMLKALEYVKAFGGILLQLPMDSTLNAGALMHEGETSTRLGMPGSPEIAETLALHRDIELLRYTRSRLHVTGISTAASVELIRRAKSDGLDISCSVTPYHLLLTDAALQTYDSVYKVNPPLRTEADRQALIAGLKDGTIDCIASHHRPQDWDAKQKEFEYAANGMNLQQILFPLLWTELGASLGLELLVEKISSAPRRIFGLPEADIAEGAAARLSIFSTNGEEVLPKAAWQSLSLNHPFANKSLRGGVAGIFAGGRLQLFKQ